MLISDIEEDKKLTIDVLYGSNKISFESKSISILNNDLLIESIKHDNQILNMNSPNIVIAVTIDTEPIPIKFNDVKINTVRYKDEIYHLIKTNKEGKEINRRNSFRVFIGEEGIAQINQNKKGRDVLVKDVSLGGFAIISQDDLEADNAIVRLTYIDKDTKIVLNGKVVRKEILDENKILYGCELIHTPNGLNKYLNKKQMKK